MSKRDLLVEIGTEELPPKSLSQLSHAFADYLKDAFVQKQLDMADLQVFASPRRLAVLFTELDDTTPDETTEQWGPPAKIAFDADGKPSKAGKAFAEKNGIASDNLAEYVRHDGKQDKLFVSQTSPGVATKTLLSSIVSDALSALPIAKRMRWGATRNQFVRPVHWVTILFGEEHVAGEIMGLSVGNTTRGHRFHCNRELTIFSAGSYEAILENDGYVIADFAKRKEQIRTQVTAAGESLGGRAVISEDLLNEVTALVEWPVALAGRFEERFLNVPAEALISSMKEHQKYFHVVDSNDSLMPHFITVANIASSDPQKIIDGNERVIRPRLSDAAFFYEVDCKTSLEARREKLKKVVFQEKLGSLFDKTVRLEKLAGILANKLGVDTTMPCRAAALSKSDLVSEMVFEFDDMQGIAGSYYAQNDGESDDVARAMIEQYQPGFAGDSLPQTTSGTILALADRLDTITGIFGIGQNPSGSKDPFGLRRASLGVMRIIIEKQLPLDLAELIAVSLGQHPQIENSDEKATTVLQYMQERLRAWYEDQCISVEMFRAVSAKQISAPYDFHRRVLAVKAFAALPESESLAAANKRVANILDKTDGHHVGEVESSLLEEGAERNLADNIEALNKACQPLLTNGDYQSLLKQLSALKGPVDEFFDKVMVNVDDDAVRNNRLRLLNALRLLFLEVADISQLVPSKN